MKLIAYVETAQHERLVESQHATEAEAEAAAWALLRLQMRAGKVPQIHPDTFCEVDDYDIACGIQPQPVQRRTAPRLENSSVGALT